MKTFAALIDRIGRTQARNDKLGLIVRYLRATPDPERGYALAALTGDLAFRHARPGQLRALIAERTDPVLFALSYDYVGDLSETIALMWPAAETTARPPHLTDVVTTLQTLPAVAVPAVIAGWLDSLDETGRWALLKLITGGLRIGVSGRLARTALALLGPHAPAAIEEVWHGQSPPYVDLIAFAEGRLETLATADAMPFRPPMLAHPLDEADLAALDAALHRVEWKWDGIRAQLVGGRDETGQWRTRLYSRSGDDITAAFPDLVNALAISDAALDGELLVLREGRVQPFAALQQRLNRKIVPKRLIAEHPAHFRAYDLIAHEGADLRPLSFDQRRARLEAFVAAHPGTRLDLSPLVPVATQEEIAAARAHPAEYGAGADADAVEGVMIKRAASPYTAGRPRGEWWKWKRTPYTVDAVLMYTQRGHGKRSSFYSDYTFGVWREGALVPVGKAYSGFTDAELKEIDRFIRAHTINRYGPVREVTHTADTGLVFEVAFEGLNRSSRNKSGLAMRFPRIARIRWDKRPADAGHLGELEALLKGV